MDAAENLSLGQKLRQLLRPAVSLPPAFELELRPEPVFISAK